MQPALNILCITYITLQETKPWNGREQTMTTVFTVKQSIDEW